MCRARRSPCPWCAAGSPPPHAAARPAAEPHWPQPGWPAHRAASRHTVHTRYTLVQPLCLLLSLIGISPAGQLTALHLDTRYTHGTHTVHTRYTHGTHTVHTRTAALPAAEPHWHQPGWPAHRAASRHTVHTRYTHGTHTVHPRYTHGAHTYSRSACC